MGKSIATLNRFHNQFFYHRPPRAPALPPSGKAKDSTIKNSPEQANQVKRPCINTQVAVVMVKCLLGSGHVDGGDMEGFRQKGIDVMARFMV